MEVAKDAGAWCGLAEVEPDLRNFLAPRCRDASELDDVVQETLLRGARYRAGLCDPERLRPWLLRIGANVLHDHVRRESRLHRVEPAEDVLERVEGREPDPGAGGELVALPRVRQVVEKDVALEKLCGALQGLRTEDRRVLGSYYDRGDRAEAARVCDISPKLVKVRLFRARRRLLRRLHPQMQSAGAAKGSHASRGRSEGEA